MLFFFKELDLSEGRTTGIPTIQDKLRKNGSLPARIETDDARSYFLIEIPNWEGFKNTIESIEKESELKSGLKDELKGEHCIDRVGGKKYGRWMVLMSYSKYLICNYNWTISSLYEDGFN